MKTTTKKTKTVVEKVEALLAPATARKPRKMANFSRFNQPQKCHACGKLSTWSEANGYGGLNLCRECFDRATLQNDHFDNGHAEVKAGCPECEKASAAVTAPTETTFDACRYCGKSEFEGANKGRARRVHENACAKKAKLAAAAHAADTKKIEAANAVPTPPSKETKAAARAAVKKAAAKKVAVKEKAKAAKKVAVADDGALTVSLNTRGRLYFGNAAAARVEGMAYFTITVDGKSIKIDASKAKGKSGVAIKRLNGHPRVRVTRLLREMGWNGEKLSLTATAVGDHGFELALGKAVK
jgi:hypothetical protein